MCGGEGRMALGVVHGAAYLHSLAEMYSAAVRCDGRFFPPSDEVTYVLSASVPEPPPRWCIIERTRTYKAARHA